ncbi:RdgB/HAM1 family non-canonical purine NTP pyrophosphatase [Candidatus Omnitrophota bacterium]
MELVVATKNQDKLKEIKTLLKGLPVTVLSLNGFKGVPEVKEDKKTLEGNAKKKALQTSRFLKKLVVADDSGLEVEALKGAPGVYSARFSGKGATYNSNNKKLLRLLLGLPKSKRKARFRCAIALADRGKLVGVRDGICIGKIGFKLTGRSGFGYDPLFMPSGCKKTFAQLGLKKKNEISHRGKALIKAKKMITRYCRDQEGLK